jgi:hypothetical protein
MKNVAAQAGGLVAGGDNDSTTVFSGLLPQRGRRREGRRWHHRPWCKHQFEIMCNLSRDSESKYVVPEYCDTEIRGGAVLPQKKYSYEKRTLEYLRKNKQSMVSQIKKNPIRVGVVSVM